MKKMVKFVICFMFCFSGLVSAQRAAGQGNVEALENINLSLERIENAITSLTSQNEENAYNQKNAKAETEIILKDMKLQIKEVRDEQEKLAKDVYAQKIEIENLKNIVAMLQEKLASFSKNEQSDKKGKNDSSEVKEEATKNPTDLLVVVKKEEKVEKVSDDESFDLAFSNFEKKDFTESAINFASNLKNFPDGKNFYKNLFYLGLSMKELNNKNGACTAFAKIVNSNEKSDDELKSKASFEFNQFKCNPNKTDENN